MNSEDGSVCSDSSFEDNFVPTIGLGQDEYSSDSDSDANHNTDIDVFPVDHDKSGRINEQFVHELEQLPKEEASMDEAASPLSLQL